LNILKPAEMEKQEFFKRCETVNDLVLRLFSAMAVVFPRSMVGMVKKKYLGYTKSAEEIVVMKGIKRVFDPNGIMNPGKLIDSE